MLVSILDLAHGGFYIFLHNVALIRYAFRGIVYLYIAEKDISSTLTHSGIKKIRIVKQIVILYIVLVCNVYYSKVTGNNHCNLINKNIYILGLSCTNVKQISKF